MPSNQYETDTTEALALERSTSAFYGELDDLSVVDFTTALAGPDPMSPPRGVPPTSPSSIGGTHIPEAIRRRARRLKKTPQKGGCRPARQARRRAFGHV